MKLKEKDEQYLYMYETVGTRGGGDACAVAYKEKDVRLNRRGQLTKTPCATGHYIRSLQFRLPVEKGS